MFSAYGLWAERDLYRAKPAVTRYLSFMRSRARDRPPQSLRSVTAIDGNTKGRTVDFSRYVSCSSDHKVE